jgi:hypothetical protein
MTIETLKPWGKEELLHQGHGYAVKRITLESGHQTSLHYHEIKHEMLVVFKGELQVRVKQVQGEERIVLLLPGDFIVIDPTVIHQMSAPSVSTIYVESQSDHLDDVIRLNDNYGRI